MGTNYHVFGVGLDQLVPNLHYQPPKQTFTHLDLSHITLTTLSKLDFSTTWHSIRARGRGLRTRTTPYHNQYHIYPLHPPPQPWYQLHHINHNYIIRNYQHRSQNYFNIPTKGPLIFLTKMVNFFAQNPLQNDPHFKQHTTTAITTITTHYLFLSTATTRKRPSLKNYDGYSNSLHYPTTHGHSLKVLRISSLLLTRQGMG